jgi:hypothetical protein
MPSFYLDLVEIRMLETVFLKVAVEEILGG